MNAKLEAKRKEAENKYLRLKLLSPENQIREKRTRALQLEEMITRAMDEKLVKRKHRLALFIEQFKGLSPLTKLNQGYSYVEDKEGKALKKLGQVHPGDLLTIHVSDGRVLAKVTEKLSPMAKKENKDDFRGKLC